MRGRDPWYWNYTARGVQHLLGEVFKPSDVSVQSYGNLVSAIAVLEGLSAGELKEVGARRLRSCLPGADCRTRGQGQVMGRVRQLIHRGRLAFKRRYVARGLILIYHRVAEDPIDPWRLCVSPENFARHMEILRKKGFKTVHVSELADSVRARRVPRKTVAVTFDDGYRDNLDAARPILERYETPATHFATAGYIGSDEPFWWDVLDAVFLRTENLPE